MHSVTLASSNFGYTEADSLGTEMGASHDRLTREMSIERWGWGDVETDLLERHGTWVCRIDPDC